MLLITGVLWCAMLLNAITMGVLHVGTGSAWWLWPTMLFLAALMGTVTTGVTSVVFAILNRAGK
jgi:hypothetical protein